MNRPVFAVPFSWDSAIGRAVEVVAEAVPAASHVIELGAGRGAAAERFRHRDLGYAAVVADDGERAELASRGFAARRADLADPGSVVAALDELARADRPGAVIVVDVLDRCPGPVLAAVRDWFTTRPEVMLVVSTSSTPQSVLVAPAGSAANLLELLRVHGERSELLDDVLARYDTLEARMRRRPVRLAGRAVGLVDRVRRR